MLNAASASSPSDAWAVGRITQTNKNHYRITTPRRPTSRSPPTSMGQRGARSRCR
jgi:hypothetical protein